MSAAAALWWGARWQWVHDENAINEFVTTAQRIFGRRALPDSRQGNLAQSIFERMTRGGPNIERTGLLMLFSSQARRERITYG